MSAGNVAIARRFFEAYSDNDLDAVKGLEFFGHAATGNEMGVPFINIMRIENGLNVEEWDAFDTLSFMTQIGAVPGS
jgi:hypothetical protein